MGFAALCALVSCEGFGSAFCGGRACVGLVSLRGLNDFYWGMKSDELEGRFKFNR